MPAGSTGRSGTPDSCHDLHQDFDALTVLWGGVVSGRLTIDELPDELGPVKDWLRRKVGLITEAEREARKEAQLIAWRKDHFRGKDRLRRRRGLTT